MISGTSTGVVIIGLDSVGFDMTNHLMIGQSKLPRMVVFLVRDRANG